MSGRKTSQPQERKAMDEQLKGFFAEFNIPLSRAPHFFTRLAEFVAIPEELSNAAKNLQRPVEKPKSNSTSSRKRPSTSKQPADSQISNTLVNPGVSEDDPGFLRLKEIEKELHARLAAVSNNLGRNEYKMEVGEGVLCLSHGYYYECEVISRGPPQKVESNGNSQYDTTDTLTYNVYSVRFKGWSKRYDCLVAENHLIMRKTKAGFANVFGMMFAHEWNTFHYAAVGLEEKDLGRGFWLLSDEVYADLERNWQRETKQSISFADYCKPIV